MNFLFVNGGVLVPTFGDRVRDRQALARLQQALPGRRVWAWIAARSSGASARSTASRSNSRAAAIGAGAPRACRESVRMRTRTGRLAADLAFSRAAGAPLVDGNAVRLLADAAENYPAWLEAIAAAEHFVHFESYIIHDDRAGALFAEALSHGPAPACGCGSSTTGSAPWARRRGPIWYPLRDAGVEVRAFNRPVAWRPLAWLSRDHRKMLAVDGRVAYVSGLCVGDAWVGVGHGAAVARHGRGDPRPGRGRRACGVRRDLGGHRPAPAG